MSNYLVIQHKSNTKTLIWALKDKFYAYYRGNFTRYPNHAIAFPGDTKIISRFQAKRHKEAILNFNLLE